MANARWGHFGSYSGPVIRGTTTIPVPQSVRFVDRAYWLTTRVETNGTYGSVVMFDGTGVTAGPDQHILVYPKELANEDFKAEDDQGPLGALLARLLPLSSYGKAIEDAFLKANLTIAPSGRLLYAKEAVVQVKGRPIHVAAGNVAHGAYIRDFVTPIGGAVPPSGPQWDQSVRIASLFHQLFSDPATFSTQRSYGLEHMEKNFKRLKIRNTPIEKVCLGGDIHTACLVPNRTAMDLAMCVWYSNSVNAPAIALRCLEAAWISNGFSSDPLAFPKAIVKYLGTSTFGRWNASIASGRYQRTRSAAMASKLWDAELFNTVMPKQLT